MTTTGGGAISMKLISPSQEILKKEMSQAKLPISSLEAISSSKEKLFSIGLGTSNCSSAKKNEPCLSPQFQFNPTNSLSSVQNSVGSKPRKRTRSKSVVKNRKKGKMCKSSNPPDDEALDTDIVAIVESLDTNKNLDSDSSTNTIILDDLNNVSNNNIKDDESKFVNLVEKRTKDILSESLFNDINFQGGNDSHLPVTTTSSYSFPILPQNKGSSLLMNNQEISTNFYNSSKGRLLISQEPLPVSESLNFPVTKSSNKEVVSQKSLFHSEPSVSLLSKSSKDINDRFLFQSGGSQDENKSFLDASNINSVFVTTSNPLSNLGHLVTDYVVDSPFVQSYPINLTKKSEDIISGAPKSKVKEQLTKKSISSTGSLVDQKLNSQSVYASMGLDEDLCDLDCPRQAKNPQNSLISNELNNLKIPIKIENDKSPPSIPSCTVKKNYLSFHSKNEIVSNDLHVSMTFEAEPSVDEEEDDIPLCELKNRKSLEDMVSKIKENSEWNNFVKENIHDIHPSLFIKKELIEDEIVSESQAVSSQNLFSVAVPNNNTEVKTSISSGYNDFMTVKIKTEPKEDYPGTEPIDNISDSFNCNAIKVAACNTGLIPKTSLGVEHNTSLELTVNKSIHQQCNTTENTAFLPFAQVLQSENKLDKNSASSLLPVSNITSKESNYVGNISDTSGAVLKKDNISVTVTKTCKKNNTGKKRKLSSKNIKVASTNDITSSIDFVEPETSLTKEALQKFSMCEGSSDFNSNQCATDTDTESNSSSNKGKKKKSSVVPVMNENVPITLLIKRFCPRDENTPNSFLCTNISKSGVGETKSPSAVSAADNTLMDSQAMKIKENTSSSINNPFLQSETLITQQNNKKQNKKMQIKKLDGGKKLSSSKSSEMTQRENVSLKPIGKQYSGNVQLNSNNFENSKVAQNLQSLKCADDIKKQSIEQKAYVYMTFEEQSAEENSEDDMNLVLPIKKEQDYSPPVKCLQESSDASTNILSVIKNIKQEKEDFSHLEPLVLERTISTQPDCNYEATHLSQVEDTVSTISSVASNPNIDDDSNVSVLSNVDSSVDLNLNVQTKKKKRRPRSNGWYKKKKSKSKSKTKAQILPSVELKESTDLPAMSSNKVPVVVIKNLLPEMKLPKRDGILKINNTVPLEQESAVLLRKSKKKKKSSKTSGKKKKAAKLNQNCTNNEAAPKDAGSVEHKDTEVLDCSSQSDSVKLPEKTNSGNDKSAGLLMSVSDQSNEIPVTASENSSKSNEANSAKRPHVINDCDVHSFLTNSSTEKSRYASFPSLDVNKISQEIEAYEALLQNLDEKSIQCLNDDSRESNIPPKVSKLNILETSNVSSVSRKSNSFSNFEALVHVKKEPENDPKASVYCLRDDSLLSSNKNDKSGSLCSVTQMSNESLSVRSSKELPVKDADYNSPLSNLSQVKKEKTSVVQDKSEISATTMISDKPILENQSDKITDSVSITNTHPAMQSESLKNVPQNPFTTDIDKLALSIKKEINNDAKSRSSVYGFKDQNDLIQKACVAQPGKLTIASSSLSDRTNSTKSVSSLQFPISESEQRCNLTGEDDEIQILQIANQKNSKDVPIVDLTEENISDSAAEIQSINLECKAKSEKIFPMLLSTAKVSDISCDASQNNVAQESSPKLNSLKSSARQVNANKVNMIQCHALPGNTVESRPLQSNAETWCGNLYELTKKIKTECSNVTSSSISIPVSSDFSLKEKSHQIENKQLITENKASWEELRENDRKFPKTNEDSLESVTKEKDFPVKIEISNSTISKDKYFVEYFKHPFPPSVVLHNIKQRNRNKMYTRINSKALNLSIEEVETRLKLSENIMHQLDRDAARLEKYPVSVNEVECYHRILGVAPNHKLLYKCFKSPEKKANKFISNGLNVFSSVSQTNVNTVEIEKQKMTCSLDDILKGITETKMMYSNSNVENNISATEKDCTFTESRDSCDSFVSNMSGVHNRGLKTVDNINEVGNEYIHNENSNSRSSALSCRLPTFSESNSTNINFMASNTSVHQFVSSHNSNENINIFPSQSTLDCFSLPTQDTINSIINASSPSVGNYSELNNNVNSIESQSSSCQSFNAVTGFKLNDESNLQSEKKQNFDIDLPVTELRKILLTAESLCSDATKFDDGSLWKSKATYEYNHTQSVPVVEKSSERNNLGIGVLPSQIKSFSNYASQPAPLQDETNGRQVAVEAITVFKSTRNACTDNVKDVEPGQSSSAKKTVKDDSDSDCVDNEPICNDEYDRERDETSSHSEEHATAEHPLPQYKSKWEKIMERKSLENKEEEIVNKHMLKDCFPVASTITRNVVSHKNVSKINEKTEKHLKGTSSEKKQNKHGKIDKTVKQNDSNSSKFNQSKQNKKSSKNNKGKEEKKTKNTSEKETKNKTVDKNKSFMSKKNKISEDSSNLFVPDKPVKISKSLQKDIHKSNDNNDRSKRFYGNRITNRGTFLTESSSTAELLKKIKIPKKKKTEVPKKIFNVRSEEFHSMVKSPDINIVPAFHPYKTFNKSLDYRKNSESYRSPLERTSSSTTTSHFMRTKHARDRRMYRSDFHPQERQQYNKIPCDPRSNQSKIVHDGIVGRKTLLSTPPNISPLMNDESSLDKKSALLSTPSIPFLQNDENPVLRKTALNILSGISPHPCNDESLLCKNNSNLPSIQPKLPVESIQPNSDMKLLHSIISAIKSNQIPTVPEIDNEDELRLSSDSVNTSWDKYDAKSLACNFKESSRQSLNIQLNMPSDPAASVNKSIGNIHPVDFFDTPKPLPTHSFPTAPLKNPFDSVLDSSGIVNSPPFTSPASSSTHIPSQPSRKAICLVPQHLKTLVGHKTLETHNVRLLMLEWSVDWLVQQQQFHDPPPISNALQKVVSRYDSFEDYYNTYFPLMLLETWHRIYVSWTHLNQANPYSCQITSYSVKSQYVSVECQTVFNTAAHPKGVFPDEGSILMVKYTTKSNEYTIKILGYVTNVKTRRFNCVTDSKLFSSLRLYKDANPDVLQILSLTFMGAYNSEDIDKRQPIRIHVLCNVKPTLKQNDAMLFINNSPLQRSILNPVADGLLSFTLTPRNSPLEKTNECVRDITKGILTPHPLPLLTVVRAKPESDRLNIIPMLIEKMKCAYKTKVLLCVRTVRALGDIAANICLHQSLKLVIINKRCDTNPQFQKFLLDDLAAAEMSKCSEDKVNEKHHIKNETVVKMKKQVLKECDVVLSLIRNCHDEFIGETFTETDCISQMCCIVDEANLCTEPETLIPILHGISKLILIGDSDYPAKVLSKTASAYDYSQSFFQRAYDLDLITE